MIAELRPGTLDPAPDSLSAKLAPEVVAILEDQHDELAELAGQRIFGTWVFNAAWPLVLRIAPYIVAKTVEIVRGRYGEKSLTLNQVLDMLAGQLSPSYLEGPPAMQNVCMHPAFVGLHEEITSEVANRLATLEVGPRPFGAPGPQVVGDMASIVLMGYLISLGKAAIKPLEDAAVAHFGGAIEQLVLSQRDAIRSFVSDHTFEFVHKCLHDLMELKPGPIGPDAPPEPEPA